MKQDRGGREQASSPGSAAPPPKAPRYYWEAFNNVYNYTLLAGGAVASALTLNPLPLLFTLGVEGLWLSLGTELPPFKRAVDRRHAAAVAAHEAAAREARVATLPDSLQAQYRQIAALRADIQARWEQSPSLARPLLAEEVARLETLLDSYLELALGWVHVSGYLEKSPPARLRIQLGQERTVAERMPEGPAKAVALRNLEVLQQRLDRLNALEKQADVAKGQMVLMLNTLQLLRDQLVAAEPVTGVSGRLDELIGVIDAAKEALTLMEGVEDP